MMQKNNRWLIATMGTLMQLCLGTVYAWSYFQNPISETYRWSNSQVAWVFSIAIFMLGIAAAFGGTLMPKYGPRRLATIGGVLYSLGYLIAAFALQQHNLVLLYLGFGIIGGIGLGLAYVTPVAAVSKWFPDKQGLVTGMVVMGFGLGAVLMSKVLAPVFIKVTHNNMSAVFIYIGVTLLVLTTFAASFLKMPPAGKAAYDPLHPEPTGDSTPLLQIIFTRQFVLMWPIFTCIVVAGMVFISFQSPLLQDLLKLNMPAGTDLASDETQHYLIAAGATLIALSSICNGLGRLVWGALSDKIGRLQAFRIILILLAVIFALLIFLKQPVLFSILVCVVLLCYGGGFGVLPSFVKEVFGTHNMATVYGAMLTAWGVGGIIGPQIVAFTKDNYPEKAGIYSFGIGLALLLIGLLLSLIFKKEEKAAV
ncbi:MAG TPA: OFA family MFS transporter [Niabella sp.]|nr:OFA family MFS transporter [Niabella sp.]